MNVERAKTNSYFNPNSFLKEKTSPADAKIRILAELHFFATTREYEFQPTDSIPLNLRSISRSLKGFADTTYARSGAFGFQTELSKGFTQLTFKKDQKFINDLAIHLNDLAKSSWELFENFPHDPSLANDLILEIDAAVDALKNNKMVQELTGLNNESSPVTRLASVPVLQNFDGKITTSLSNLQTIKEKIQFANKNNPLFTLRSQLPSNENEKLFGKNSAVIKNYQNGYASALKINDDGELVNTKFVTSGLFYSTSNQGLPAVVKCIENSCNHPKNKFEVIHKFFQNNIFFNRAEEQLCLLDLQEAISNEEELLEGMVRIKDAYKGYKEFEPLSKQIEELKKRIETHNNQYAALIAKLDKTKLSNNNSLMFDVKEDAKKTTPHESIRLYCKAYNPTMSPSQAIRFATEGGGLVADILSGKRTKPSQNEAEEVELAQISWFLLSLALKKKEGFLEGTFVLEDPENKLYNFLCACPSIHSRPSSHFEGRLEGNKGVNILKQTVPMPSEKRTLLFERVKTLSDAGQVVDGYLFIKPENWTADHNVGKNPAVAIDFPAHGAEFVAARKVKMLEPGADDKENMRKERIPAVIQKLFPEILKELNPAHIAQAAKGLGREEWSVEKNSKVFGISYMKKFLENVNKLQDTSNSKNIDQFNKIIAEYDHLEMRTGREVILTAKELT